MPIAQYLIVAGGAFVAGLTVGPILNPRTRRGIAAGGVVAAIVGGALIWPPSLSLLRDTLPFDLLGLDTLGVEFLVAGLLGLAAALLPFAFGADITGS